MHYQTRERLQIASLVLYAAIAFVTFGHAWHRIDNQRLPADMQFMGAMFCSAVWPAYASVILWEKFNANQP